MKSWLRTAWMAVRIGWQLLTVKASKSDPTTSGDRDEDATPIERRRVRR